MLSGHTDVVPVEGQTWSSDPFTLTRRDDRLFGRGAADMKSFLALAVALAPEFVARGLVTPLHLAFSYDEEVGCVGVRRLIADLATLPVKPRPILVPVVVPNVKFTPSAYDPQTSNAWRLSASRPA